MNSTAKKRDRFNDSDLNRGLHKFADSESAARDEFIAVAAYAREFAGTPMDLDEELEAAAVEFPLHAEDGG